MRVLRRSALHVSLHVRGRKPGEIRRPTTLNQRTSPRNFANLAKTGVFRRRFASQRSPVRARLAPSGITTSILARETQASAVICGAHSHLLTPWHPTEFSSVSTPGKIDLHESPAGSENWGWTMTSLAFSWSKPHLFRWLIGNPFPMAEAFDRLKAAIASRYAIDRSLNPGGGMATIWRRRISSTPRSKETRDCR